MSEREPTGTAPQVPAGNDRKRAPARSRRGRLIREGLRGAFVDNAALKFVAFVLALTVFILVQSDEDVHVGVAVAIEYRLPKDRLLVTDRPDEVRLTVRGSRRTTRRFTDRSQVPIKVDLSRHRGSEWVFRKDDVKIPDGLEFVRFTPESFRTEFEQRTEKVVPIEVKTEGSLAAGYLIKDITSVPGTVRISGAASEVASVSAVKTHTVVLADRTESFSQVVGLVSPGQFSTVIEDEPVEVSVTLVQEQGDRRVGPVALTLRPGPDSTEDIAGQLVADPKEVTITLRGWISDLESIDAASLAPYVEVHTQDLALRRTRTARVVVNVPARVGVEITPAEVTIRPKQ